VPGRTAGVMPGGFLIAVDDQPTEIKDANLRKVISAQ
jgi:hypothetical protein